jgi:prepilin-type N-terminal cleavage/methylation domain-containing protein
MPQKSHSEGTVFANMLLKKTNGRLEVIMMKLFRQRQGFTLLELMTVVVIIGIIAAMAMPNFDLSIKKIRFKSASNSIVSGLRLARSAAISQKVQHGVNFDATNNVISVFKDQTNPASFTFDGSDSVIFQDTLSRGFEGLTTSFLDDLVFFFPDGRASSTGAVNGSNQWGELSASVQISVLAATGRIKVDSLSY